MVVSSTSYWLALTTTLRITQCVIRLPVVVQPADENLSHTVSPSACGFAPSIVCVTPCITRLPACGCVLYPQWDNYMHQMEPIISRLPYMTVPGNHGECSFTAETPRNILN